MKKIALTLLIVMISVGTMGCGSNESSSKEKELEAQGTEKNDLDDGVYNDDDEIALGMILFKENVAINSDAVEVKSVSKIKIDFANPDTLVQVYTVLKNKYPKSEIVVTLEEKGALYAVDGQIKVMPGLKVSPVDTTGAGDIFHGAFTYGIAKGYDLEKVIRYANITAGLSIQKMGARVSIPSISEVTNYYNEKFPVNNTPSAQNATQTPVQQDNANNNAVQTPQISTIPVVPQNPTPAEFNQPSVANMPINTAPSMEVQNNFNNPNPNLNQNVAGSPMTYEQATLYNQQNNGNLNG